MAAGKTYDVMINAPRPAHVRLPALPVFDRELSLSGNTTARDAGMLAYIGINGAGLPATARQPRPRCGQIPITRRCRQSLTVSDPVQGPDRERHQCLWRQAGCNCWPPSGR